MSDKHEIRDMNDIKLLVDTFYQKVRNNEKLKDIFNNVIQERWSQHLEKMYRFWQTILLDAHTYYGSPFPPHAKLPVDNEHFDVWMELFFQTVDEYFFGEKAEKAKAQGQRMAAMFQFKIEYYKNH